MFLDDGRVEDMPPVVKVRTGRIVRNAAGWFRA
jgi:hypothetical protein